MLASRYARQAADCRALRTSLGTCADAFSCRTAWTYASATRTPRCRIDIFPNEVLTPRRSPSGTLYKFELPRSAKQARKLPVSPFHLRARFGLCPSCTSLLWSGILHDRKNTHHNMRLPRSLVYLCHLAEIGFPAGRSDPLPPFLGMLISPRQRHCC